MQIRDIMTTDPTLISPQSSVREAARMMQELDIGALVVGVQNKPQGLVTDRDLAIRVLAEGKDAETEISEVMSDQLITCSQDDDVEKIADRMKQERVLRLVVTDDSGMLVGIVSHGDLADAAQNDNADMLKDSVTHIAAQESADQEEMKTA